MNGSIGGLISTLGDQVSLLDTRTGQVAKDGTWEKADWPAMPSERWRFARFA